MRPRVSLADGSADGFAFDGDSPPALMAAVRRASALFRERAIWLRMMRRAMTRDFSWAAAARRYVAVYRELRPDLVPCLEVSPWPARGSSRRRC